MGRTWKKYWNLSQALQKDGCLFWLSILQYSGWLLQQETREGCYLPQGYNQSDPGTSVIFFPQVFITWFWQIIYSSQIVWLLRLVDIMASLLGFLFLMLLGFFRWFAICSENGNRLKIRATKRDTYIFKIFVYLSLKELSNIWCGYESKIQVDIFGWNFSYLDLYCNIHNTNE